MLLCQIYQRLHNDDHGGSSVDWSAATNCLPADIVHESPRWITTQKRTAQEQQTLPQNQLPSVNLQNLTAEQQLAYSIVCNHHRSIIDGEVLDPLQMIICGTAGTSKSFLISALAHLLQDICLLTGTTGMAAFNICGITIHSACSCQFMNKMTSPFKAILCHAYKLIYITSNTSSLMNGLCLGNECLHGLTNDYDRQQAD